ncbi:MAG: transcription elongation factor GreB [Deltaproteobacteria bacterium]|nr:transcription elongation factor GreB [Deltaproteobacteria bacterium]MBN2671881.1 transcription elongation factor GreB [Deltaproteobacteria bacterium]
MGTRTRKRKDESKKSGYITQEGYRRLEEESHFLWNVKRPEVTEALQAAAAEGDRSENAEYIYRKKQLGEIDRRLRFLGNRLDALTMVSELPPDNGRVYFGCQVTLEDEDGTTVCYRIVGADEWNVERGEISVDSPLAKAIIGKQLDDEVLVRRPKGDIWYTITAISVTL